MMESLLAVFSVDALQSSHPVSAKIKHPSEISQIFDSISYSKGKILQKPIQGKRKYILFP
jgi:aminopeptidase N